MNSKNLWKEFFLDFSISVKAKSNKQQQAKRATIEVCEFIYLYVYMFI